MAGDRVTKSVMVLLHGGKGLGLEGGVTVF